MIVIICTCTESHLHVYLFHTCTQLAAEDVTVHGTVTLGGSHKQGMGALWLPPQNIMEPNKKKHDMVHCKPCGKCISIVAIRKTYKFIFETLQGILGGGGGVLGV